MRTRSLKFLLATMLAVFGLALNISAPVASAAESSSSKALSYSSYRSSDSDQYSSSRSKESDHSSESEECEDDDDDSDGHSSSAPIISSSKKSISIPVKASSSSSHDSEDGDDDEENCGNGGGGGDSPAEILKRVPKTVGKPTTSSCTTAAATLSWTAVISPGYAVVDKYRVRYSSNGGTTWTTSLIEPTSTTLTIAGLTAGLTYIFQVAAHNANGYGAWSASTTGCTLTAVIGTTFTYTLGGLANVPLLAPTDPYPTLAVDYQGDVAIVSRPVIALADDSGTFLKGTFTYDLYVSLPTRVGGYTFNVTGGSAPVSLGQATLVTGVGHPTSFSTISFFYSFFQVYGFTITSGSNLAITVNPLL
ncbi:unannotated protein [freshwater metagenome]|uniref:Unannotated protein n=1 Tax=freshwater metagenome TaxID=449393 RepID=A0A6J7MAX1_9ZZZZ|nr:hypothetical protein [Actinomycetota bacterium]MSX44806.1 hypothetical protein [Actinomycetota bacterium]MSX73166.1 hypothetical protein [Actinomycetota bacterium]MSZ00698.1 hypothetical protein [Actinomycetota bacterium]MTA60226.1 hypothetical protein [Actinomycetota bacterium]